MNLPTAGGPLVGVVRLAHQPTTRRRAAVAATIPGALCAGLSGAHLVRGTLLRIPAVRFRPANIRVAVGRPTLRRRVVPPPAPATPHTAHPVPLHVPSPLVEVNVVRPRCAAGAPR